MHLFIYQCVFPRTPFGVCDTTYLLFVGMDHVYFGSNIFILMSKMVSEYRDINNYRYISMFGLFIHLIRIQLIRLLGYRFWRTYLIHFVVFECSLHISMCYLFYISKREPTAESSPALSFYAIMCLFMTSTRVHISLVMPK